MKVDSPQGGVRTGEYGGLSIKIEGNERAEYTRHYTRSHGSGKNRRTTHHTQRMHMHREIFCFDAGDLNPANGYFPNGLHEATICFDLPFKCPSSMLQNNNFSKYRPLVAITYAVTAEMITEEMLLSKDTDNVTRWGSDKMFMVREPAVIVTDNQCTIKKDITACCCFERGKTAVDTAFDGSVFTPLDKAHAKVMIDN